ncbi:hypothetical protein HanRHA438_Chr09g0375711 [Helianthus annuus]|nr:hypothetical protein HanIR_Chr09g0392731 [Helianthus annuus]KAJ0886120.1 hypothetical protein HanRHA438_Chr09g0375711 [Helianthus annuus]
MPSLMFTLKHLSYTRDSKFIRVTFIHTLTIIHLCCIHVYTTFIFIHFMFSYTLIQLCLHLYSCTYILFILKSSCFTFETTFISMLMHLMFILILIYVFILTQFILTFIRFMLYSTHINTLVYTIYVYAPVYSFMLRICTHIFRTCYVYTCNRTRIHTFVLCSHAYSY